MKGTHSVRLEEGIKVRLQQLAEKQKRKPHAMMNDAIKEYVEREEMRDRFAEEAMASWIDFQETGLHITWDECKAWMDTWGTEHEIERPQCHT